MKTKKFSVSHLKNKSISHTTNNKTKKFKSSIYYNTANYDKLAKHILESPLINFNESTSMNLDQNNKLDKDIETEFNNLFQKNHDTGKPKNKKLLISFNEEIINGKKKIHGEIISDDGKYIKKYTWNNGKTDLSKIKKMI